MKPLLLLWFIGLNVFATAQTIVKSMQTTANEETLSMHIVGTHHGRPFDHRIQFNVAGLTTTQRDSLHRQAIRALNQLGIADVPGVGKLQFTPAAGVSSPEVIFRCETCIGKGRLEIYGNNYTSTRSFNTKRDAQPFFPYQSRLGAGEYRLVYMQNGVRQIQSSFTVKAGEANVVTVK